MMISDFACLNDAGGQGFLISDFFVGVKVVKSAIRNDITAFFFSNS